MIAASASTTVSTPSTPAPGAAPETPAPVDFMALLLLLSGVGTAPPQAEGQGQRPAADVATGADVPAPADDATTPPATVTGVATLALLAGPASLPIQEIEASAMGPGAPIPATPAVASPVIAGADAALPVAHAAVESATTPAIHRAAANHVESPQAAAAPIARPAPEAPRATADAQPAAGEISESGRDAVTVAPAVTAAGGGATGARDAARTSARHARSSERETASAEPLVAEAPAPRPVSHAVVQRIEVARPVAAERDAGAEDGRPIAATGNAISAARGAVAATPHAPATLDAAPTVEPRAAIEPRAVAEQVVRAARLVVDGGEAEMHIALDPPALGVVRVSAEARGGALALTIAAERPETQALLAQALPEIRQALADRGVGAATVSVAHTPVSPDGRRAPERRPTEARERPTPHPGDRRRAAGPRRVSAVDITV